VPEWRDLLVTGKCVELTFTIIAKYREVSRLTHRQKKGGSFARHDRDCLVKWGSAHNTKALSPL